jgi:hypothetical protein
MSKLDPEQISRTALLFIRQAGDAGAGAEHHQRFSVRILTSAETCAVREGQAALITAVKTAVRAVSNEEADDTSARVTVVLPDPTQVVLGGPCSGAALGNILEFEGARVVGELTDGEEVSTIVLGHAPSEIRPEADWTIATWSGWTASVAPFKLAQSGDHCDGNVLAAIAAGALAVAEVFLCFSREAGDDAGERRIQLDLWSPETNEGSDSPPLRYAPAQWWLLGLGHLGQAYAHAISWLDYPNPTEVDVVVQDIQRTVPANHSTGLLTPRGSKFQPKTRLVAEALEQCGLNTVIIERLMDEPTPVRASDMHVALVGVDNRPTRRQIDTFGWKTTIDVGLGAGTRDFDGITLFRFPGRPSADIPAWQEPAPGSAPADDEVSAPDLDPCGIARLNGVAVGASFVGAIAGVVAVSEALRPLHGGDARSVLCLSVGEAAADGAPTTRSVDLPVAFELRE